MTLLCPQCFTDRGLKRRLIEIRPTYPNEKCAFHPSLKGIPVRDITTMVDEVFRNNYSFNGYEGSHRRYDEHAGNDLETTLYDLTGADDHGVIEALSHQLIEDDDYWPQDGGEPLYGEDILYVRSAAAFDVHSRLWDEFRKSIIYGQRFFNERAKDLLAEIFDGIHLQGGSGSRAAVYEIQPGCPGSTVFRVRAEDDPKARKAIESDVPTHLGAPPLRKRRAGRMNPSGVTTLYAAFDLETCVAELRPTIGSAVVAAQFDVIRPIWALDTTRFDAPSKEPNLFSKDHMKRSGQRLFMQRFMREIAQPISPGDEHLDYIPTQAVAEFLLHHHTFHLKGERHRIEAVIYRSAQRPSGKNIAILGDACLIEAAPPAVAKPKPVSGVDPFDSFLDALPRWNAPGRAPRLRMRPGSFQVRRVKEALFETEAFTDYVLTAQDVDDAAF